MSIAPEFYTYEITSNYHRRPVLFWHELTDKERKELITQQIPTSRKFVRYRGETYDLHDIPSAPNRLKELGFWGFIPTSYATGIAFGYSDGNSYDDLRIIIAFVVVKDL